MTLEQLAAGGAPVVFAAIGGDVALARGLQQRLTDCGLLDPPVDGEFGPVSHWALREWLRRARLGSKTALDAEAARRLLAPAAESVFALKTPKTLAGRIVAAMQAQRQFINRHPDCVNIVYVEAMELDGAANDDAPNVFNDVRLLLSVQRGGQPVIVGSWEATTEPGLLHTKIRKLDPRGAARIAFGQYKAWAVGIHKRGTASEHEALVQTKPVTVFRDFNEDFERAGDATETGLFGINQHWGFDNPRDDIKGASAGCLVGRTREGHRAFMRMVKADARFAVNNGYRYMASILDRRAFATA